MDDQTYSLVREGLQYTPYLAGAAAVLFWSVSSAFKGVAKHIYAGRRILAETEQIKAEAEIDETSTAAEHSRKMQLLENENYRATMKAREEEGQRQIAAYRASGVPDGFFPYTNELKGTLDAMFPLLVDD